MLSLQSNRECEDLGQRLVLLQRQNKALQEKALEYETQAASTSAALEDLQLQQARLLGILKELRVPEAVISGDDPPEADNATGRRKAKEYVADVLAFVARAYGGKEEDGNFQERMTQGEDQ